MIMATPLAIPDFYILPSSRNYKCIDRFSLLDDDAGQSLEDADGLVPFWPLLHSILSQPINSLPALTSLLDTISVTLRGTAHPAGDYALLCEAIATHSHSFNSNGDSGTTSTSSGEQAFFQRVWPRLVQTALQMPLLFPEGRIPVLGHGSASSSSSLSLSRRQAACLVVHQFLRTLATPPWGQDQDVLCDFGVWYAGAEHQCHPGAARAYLRALMGYFAEVVCDEGRIGMPRMEWEVVYTLRALSGNMNEEEDVLCEKIGKGSPLGEAEVLVMERYDTSPASLGLPGGAAVVSANRFIGFGQSATQEEVHVGTSPEACPAVLVTPPLKDDQVLIVRGAQAMVNVSGRGRNIVVDEIGVPPGGENGWRERTMLFMDALELDLVQTTEPGLSDLIRENVDREIRKACTAFSAGGFGEVRTGLWGCGAFAGDPGVKMLLLWVAASVAGIRLVAICDQGLRLFAEELQLTLEWAKQELRDTKALRQVLDRAPKCLARGQILTWIRTEYKREQPAME